eukprot:3503341-Prymnesium_polylepis.1
MVQVLPHEKIHQTGNLRHHPLNMLVVGPRRVRFAVALVLAVARGAVHEVRGHAGRCGRAVRTHRNGPGRHLACATRGTHRRPAVASRRRAAARQRRRCARSCAGGRATLRGAALERLHVGQRGRGIASRVAPVEAKQRNQRLGAARLANAIAALAAHGEVPQRARRARRGLCHRRDVRDASGTRERRATMCGLELRWQTGQRVPIP